MTLEKQELDRIEAAKTAIGTAIAGKGVAVPSGTKLDGMAALIDGIEQGSDSVLQSKSVAPSETAQTVKPDSGYDGLSQVSVGAISKTYVGSSVPKQAAQTITPGTSNKTIASGRYLTGTQTIKGDANLVAGNIAKDVTIFGVTGTHEGGEDVSAETAEYTELLTDLEAAVDALPDAGSGGGSGGSVETCDISFTMDDPYDSVFLFFAYNDAEEGGKILSLASVMTRTVTVPRGSIVAGTGLSGASGYNCTFGEKTAQMGALSVFTVSQNGTLSVTA